MMQIFMIGTNPVCGFSVATTIYRNKMRTPVKKCYTVLLFCFFSIVATAQLQPPENKIDMAFRFLLANKEKISDASSFGRFPEQFKIEPTEGFAPGKIVPEKRYDCIIYTRFAQQLKDSGYIIRSILPKFVTAWVTLEQVEQLSRMTIVDFIEAPRTDKALNDVPVGNTGASLLHNGRLNNTTYKGKGVIVAIFDSGIDWKHLDFRNPDDTTKSRILRIWDQTITPVAGESSPAVMGYGVEYTQAHISNELDGTPAGYVRENDVIGHGTHIAGTAAGNGNAIPATRKYAGMAPEADIVVIKGGDGSFSITNIINALTYLKNLATELGRPVVLNISIGGQFGPHDGTLSYEVAVDDFTASAPGRAVVIAAGNDNGASTHDRLVIPGSATGTVSFTVPGGTTGNDVFAYRVYANNNSPVTATVSAPGGGTVTATAGQSASGYVVSDSFNLMVYNQIDINNNDRYIEVYVTRRGINTSPAGTWTLAIINTTNDPLTLDGWLYYRNSNFSDTRLIGGNNTSLVLSPGNANSAITVGSFAGQAGWYSYSVDGAYFDNTAQDNISYFSAHGPRRDSIIKPEVTAIGQHVISAYSSSTSSAASSDIILPGRYIKSQGTSISTPVVTGAVALLMQAHPSATIMQLRNAIFTTTTKDILTDDITVGPTPNATWGYGRLDVFKAVSSLFGCTPVDRKTYQYDASNITSLDNDVTNTNTRVAVRFIPDINGKLAGGWYHTSASKTSLVMEIRGSNAGVPGNLLTTVNLPDTIVAANSWNYIDLSGLNIPVTAGVNYFLMLYRDASSTANWSIRRENTLPDNSTLTSTDGTNWSNPGYDYKIRSVVYSHPQMAGIIANANSSDTRVTGASNQFINNNCQLIAQLVPAGANPVSGSVATNVWIESSVPHIGRDPFVARHYQMAPATLAGTSTGRVTLYFKQEEFTAYNNDVSKISDLPANPTDAVGKANLRIGKYAGTSNDGTGLPNSYAGAATVIDPNDTDIVWNADTNRWEITFDINGFGGFVVQTKTTVLPIVIEYFTGKKDNSTNILEWKVVCGSSNTTRFTVERSADGASFNSIGSLSAAQARCTQPFTFTDRSPVSGTNYYRIKIIEANGSVYYTNVVLLQWDRTLTNGLYPTYLVKGSAVQVSFAGTGGLLVVNDATGKQVYSHTLRTGVQSITIPAQASGIYFYKLIENNKTVVAGGKLVIQ